MRRSKMAPIRQLYWSFTNAIIAFSYLPFKGVSMSTVGTMRTKDGFMLTGSSSSLKATTSFYDGPFFDLMHSLAIARGLL